MPISLRDLSKQDNVLKNNRTGPGPKVVVTVVCVLEVVKVVNVLRSYRSSSPASVEGFILSFSRIVRTRPNGMGF